jgi:hypothetical protein
MTDYPFKDYPLLDRTQDIVGNGTNAIIGMAELALDGGDQEECKCTVQLGYSHCSSCGLPQRG